MASDGRRLPSPFRGALSSVFTPFRAALLFLLLTAYPGGTIFGQTASPGPSLQGNGQGRQSQEGERSSANTRQNAGKEKQATGTHYELECTVTLGDGRKIKGTAKFTAPESMVVTHVRDGLSYEKKIRITNIRQIEIKQWKGEPLRQNKSGWVYTFRVARFTIRLTSGVTLTLQSDMFPFFKEFIFENRNGELKLFSYWLDLKNKDGSWYTGMQGPADGTRNVSHKDVVNRIEFTKE